MKKIISLILAVFMTFALAGCSCSGDSSSTSPEGSYWLDSYEIKTVPIGFSESANYKVTLEVTNTDITANGIEGSYGYEFKSVTLENDATQAVYYQLETTFALTGSYTYKNTEYPLNDSVVSNVIFKGADENLKPISAYKAIKCTSPIADRDGSIAFEKYDFSYTVDYTADSGADALVTYTDNTENKNAEFPSEKTFEGFYSSDFCENELLMLYPRMFERDDDFSLSLDVLNVANQAEETITVSTQSFEVNLTENYWDNKNLLVDCIAFAKSGTYSGTPILAYYASNQGIELENGDNLNQGKIYNHAMVKMESGIAGVGVLTYTLTSFTNNSI